MKYAFSRYSNFLQGMYMQIYTWEELIPRLETAISEGWYLTIEEITEIQII